MRYTPLAAAVSLFAAVAASSSYGQADAPLDPRVAVLIADGQAALGEGDLAGATDRFEAALVLDPGHADTYLNLARVSQAEGLYGQAIHYFREAEERDPGNLAAISGEGSAMIAKGARAQAAKNLAKLQSLCGTDCAETAALAAAIERGPMPRVKSAEAKPAEPLIDPLERN